MIRSRCIFCKTIIPVKVELIDGNVYGYKCECEDPFPIDSSDKCSFCARHLIPDNYDLGEKRLLKMYSCFCEDGDRDLVPQVTFKEV